jgi:hypothetical protein
VLNGVPPPAPPAPNQIQIENAQPGTAAWQAPETSLIEGYASEIGAAPGDAIHFHVSTRPGARYRIEVYRLGWYGGAGGRLLACVPACGADEAGVTQPLPPAPSYDPGLLDGPLRADWRVTDVVQTGTDWTSGYYVARFVLTSGADTGAAGTTFFVLREPETGRRPSQVLVQVPVNTWEAYNQWGGKSLYDFDGPRAHKVSFDRPFGKYAQSPLWWEIQLVRFLEREGYDVSYQTDVDTGRDPSSLARHRLVMTAGHDEYWTRDIRDAFDTARDLGTNLAFMGSNTGYWQVRYEDDRRTIVAYKDQYDPDPDPALKTVMFRQLVPARPECELEAVQHHYLRPHQAGPVDYTVTAAAATDPWFSGTGLAPGSVIPDVVGDEWDGLNPWPADQCEKPGLVVLLHYDGDGDPVTQRADAIRFTAPSGARVFASGAQRFAWGLDDWGTRSFGHAYAPNPGLQQLVRNMLDDETRPAPPQSVTAVRADQTVTLTVPAWIDPRVIGFVAFRKSPGQPPVRACRGVTSCADKLPGPGRYRYFLVAVDRWGRRSAPLRSAAIQSP